MRKILITAGAISMEAELDEGATADRIWQALPLSGSANVWGDEIYFSVPFELAEEDDAVQDVEVGDLAFWPPGNAFCIFYGPTPVSRGAQPRAYSPVNVFGRILGDAAGFRAVAGGSEVAVIAREG